MDVVMYYWQKRDGSGEIGTHFSGVNAEQQLMKTPQEYLLEDASIFFLAHIEMAEV